MCQESGNRTQESGLLEICIYGGKAPKCFGATILKQEAEPEPLLLVFSETLFRGSNVHVARLNDIWFHYLEIPEGCEQPHHHSNQADISEALRNWLIDKIVPNNLEDRLVEWVKIRYDISRNVSIEFKP